jgi:hypothetical protein
MTGTSLKSPMSGTLTSIWLLMAVLSVQSLSKRLLAMEPTL